MKDRCCSECGAEGRYKCPKCGTASYCSVACNKRHGLVCGTAQAPAPSPKPQAPEVSGPAKEESSAQAKEDVPDVDDGAHLPIVDEDDDLPPHSPDDDQPDQSPETAKADGKSDASAWQKIVKGEASPGAKRASTGAEGVGAKRGRLDSGPPNRVPDLSGRRPKAGPLREAQLGRLGLDAELRAQLQSPSLRTLLREVAAALDPRHLTETALLHEAAFKAFAERALLVARGPELGLRQDISDDPLAMFTQLLHNHPDNEHLDED